MTTPTSGLTPTHGAANPPSPTTRAVSVQGPDRRAPTSGSPGAARVVRPSPPEFELVLHGEVVEQGELPQPRTPMLLPTTSLRLITSGRDKVLRIPANRGPTRIG